MPPYLLCKVSRYSIEKYGDYARNGTPGIHRENLLPNHEATEVQRTSLTELRAAAV